MGKVDPRDEKDSGRTRDGADPYPERLRWFLARAELLVNSRPLTDVPVDRESQQAITPNDLLLGSSSGTKGRQEYNSAASGEDLDAFLTHKDEDIVLDYYIHRV